MQNCEHYEEEPLRPDEGEDVATATMRIAWCTHERSPVARDAAQDLRTLLGCGGCLDDCELGPTE